MEIYAVKITNFKIKLMNKLLLLIDNENRYKIERLKNEKDKIRSLIGNILVRSIIIRKIGIKNSNVVFEKDPNGKPYLYGFPDFQFNISHSGEYIVCAIDDKAVGIDVEEIIPIEYMRIARRLFTQNEIGYILKNDLEEKLNRFYEIWTLKESYVKFTGEGLNSLKSIWFSIDARKNVNLHSDFNSIQCYFKIITLSPNYKLSICSMYSNIPNFIKFVEVDDLIDSFLKM